MNSESSFLMYQTENGDTKIQVRLEGETVWMTQKAMAELFQTSPQNITLHIKNIYEEGELLEESTCKNYLQVQNEGEREVKRRVKHYNLEMIIAVGYRVRSHRGTQFRQWATERLNEYMVKGFTMDDERLKEMRNIGADYFDELLERIRDIRASERRFYQKITDIYATSIDYDPSTPIAREFFATVQNKLHFAIHGHTASELIMKRADASKPNMGLTSWKGDKVRKQDVAVAKNYLSQEELSDLNRIVTMYLDYAESQAKKKKPMYMKDWAERLDAFLEFNEHEILTNAGKIKAKVAEQFANEHYEVFHQQRLANPPKDDFDKFLEQKRLK
ncbi:virulence RhuM family protein [Heyndrickxia sporothermodurans]|uniref:virulence RhuM family protein n=1 Tax=Heyndrickxia sporothermodurans TaxID=46224 RepID=UPI002DBC8AC4|nr:virulence RhuM family protein [Heyndrickxia sporothermodurans]MEB6551156.1 virulence RhuM family protein [Heyndrickxia sporothermodurans]